MCCCLTLTHNFWHSITVSTPSAFWFFFLACFLFDAIPTPTSLCTPLTVGQPHTIAMIEPWPHTTLFFGSSPVATITHWMQLLIFCMQYPKTACTHASWLVSGSLQLPGALYCCSGGRIGLWLTVLGGGGGGSATEGRVEQGFSVSHCTSFWQSLTVSFYRRYPGTSSPAGWWGPLQVSVLHLEWVALAFCCLLSLWWLTATYLRFHIAVTAFENKEVQSSLQEQGCMWLLPPRYERAEVMHRYHVPPKDVSNHPAQCDHSDEVVLR